MLPKPGLGLIIGSLKPGLGSGFIMLPKRPPIMLPKRPRIMLPKPGGSLSGMTSGLIIDPSKIGLGLFIISLFGITEGNLELFINSRIGPKRLVASLFITNSPGVSIAGTVSVPRE